MESPCKCNLPAGFLSGTRQCSDYWVGEWKPSDGPLGSNSVKYYYFVFNVAIFLSSQNVCGGVGGGKKGRGGGGWRESCVTTQKRLSKRLYWRKEQFVFQWPILRVRGLNYLQVFSHVFCVLPFSPANTCPPVPDKLEDYHWVPRSPLLIHNLPSALCIMFFHPTKHK